jgi:hypothetical protein
MSETALTRRALFISESRFLRGHEHPAGLYPWVAVPMPIQSLGMKIREMFYWKCQAYENVKHVYDLSANAWLGSSGIGP